MAFTTKVITDTSPDFGDNPQVITESGKPASVEVDNLIANTAHWTKAEIWQDGVLNDTSDVETFTTLPAGTLTLEYIQTVRSGYAYDVTYRYTSTYAPSSAVLATNGTQFQGFIDSAQNTVSFWVTGLTAGLAYLTNVTLWDIYTESVTVTGSIVTTVVNEVRITDTTPSETSVECELDYVIDSGFYEGYVEYWLATQDPATEQAEGHTYFVDGADSVTMDGLTAGTAYLFRATILLGDGTTEIHSSVVAATTEAGTETEYFYLENTYNGENTFTLTKEGTPATRDLAYSFDKNTWVAFGLNSSTETVSVPQGGKIYLRSSTGFSADGSNFIKISMSNPHTAGGHVASLLDYTQMSSCTSIPIYSLHSLLHSDTYLTNARDIDFTGVTNIGDYGCMSMFYGCSNLISSPNLDSITRIADYGCYHMLHNCSSLTTIPSLSNLEGVGAYGLSSMFVNCSSMTTTPDLRKLKSIGDSGCYGMFLGCAKIRSGVDFSGVTSVGSNACNYLYYNCSILTTATAPKISTWDDTKFNRWLAGAGGSGVVIKPSGLSIPTNSESGVPTGWSTQDY